ncbi:hypothetical protein BMS_1641 [Halobacteriovorax marinus SJ]|uniref:Uncharacterized protein n=1 Tax=Halobacteriovorax marinus (strain ATCC BAA-682 / DSM 15412 / SJ) TaxID=862908 RepID=E1X193_HALMS|nr:hypothetical protein [Halobacteriovorax marinus]CBW26484.1 hypothetical protein BMS_1641 [Halobacteriovorax marinus SJ]
MISKLLGLGNKFLKKFEEQVDCEQPIYFSVDLDHKELKTVWLFSDESQIGLNYSQNKTILTSRDKKTKSFKSDQKLKDLIEQQIQEKILTSFERAKELIHLFPNIQNPDDGERKGEEWLKVTNHVLKESLKKASSEEHLSINAKIFMGVRPGHQDYNIRLQCYNLDYSLTFLENGKIYLSVYDDKNFERGHSKEPSYSGEFYNNRPLILDEFIKLIFEVFKKSEFRIFD